MSGYESAQESGENGSGSSIGDGSADEASPERGAAVPATRSRSRERTGSPMSEFADREEAQSPGSRQKASRKGKEPHRVPRMVVPKFSEGQHAGRASDDDPQEHHQETRTASQEYAPRQRSPRLQHERQEEPTLLKRKRPDDSPASQIEAEVKANLNSTNPGDQLPKWQRMPASAPKSSSGAQDTSARQVTSNLQCKNPCYTMPWFWPTIPSPSHCQIHLLFESVLWKSLLPPASAVLQMAGLFLDHTSICNYVHMCLFAIQEHLSTVQLCCPVEGQRPEWCSKVAGHVPGGIRWEGVQPRCLGLRKGVRLL
mmetsp:Transcript_20464/g.56739  ORF Transcript_20464/g.56739 Transcript_20464/m.56739 type:complete len:312 (+) Transcript_20464:426-1361(+)